MDWLHGATWPLFARHGQLGRWPDENERLLLEVILGERAGVADAWAAWRRNNDLDDVTGAAFQLLPQVYLRLRELSPDAPELSRLRGIYRYVWANNQRVHGTLLDCLRLFAGAGIPVLVLKGWSVLAYYGDPGARPTADLDILLPDEDVDAAHRLLLGHGWRDDSSVPLEARRLFAHGVNLVADGRHRCELDLHWRGFLLDSPARAERELWARARLAQAPAGQRYLVPDPLDLLLVTFCGARKPDRRVAGRWVTDAAMLARALDAAAWQELVPRARAAGVLAPVRECVEYLARSGWVPIPETVSGALAAATSLPQPRPWGLEDTIRKHRIGPGFGRRLSAIEAGLWFLHFCRVVHRARGVLPGPGFLRRAIRIFLSPARRLPGTPASQ